MAEFINPTTTRAWNLSFCILADLPACVQHHLERCAVMIPKIGKLRQAFSINNLAEMKPLVAG